MRRFRRGDAQLEVSITHSECQSELWADTPEMDSELDLDQSFTEHPSDGDYSQSPVKRPKWALMPLKSKVSIAQSSMFDNFYQANQQDVAMQEQGLQW